MVKHDVKDMNLAKKGALRIEWAEKEMPVLRSINYAFQEGEAFKGTETLCLSACDH